MVSTYSGQSRDRRSRTPWMDAMEGEDGDGDEAGGTGGGKEGSNGGADSPSSSSCVDDEGHERSPFPSSKWRKTIRGNVFGGGAFRAGDCTQPEEGMRRNSV